MRADDMSLEEALGIEIELVAQLGMSEDVGDGSDGQIRRDLENVRERIRQEA